MLSDPWLRESSLLLRALRTDFFPEHGGPAIRIRMGRWEWMLEERECG